jgi:hypothetical protein
MRSPHHPASHRWLTAALNGEQRVGIPSLSLGAFVRITTNPRASEHPLSPADAWGFVEEWLDSEVAWIPAPTGRHASILERLIRQYDLRANMIADAQMAALALEHGLTLHSADTDWLPRASHR